jgi:hypothetical protein
MVRGGEMMDVKLLEYIDKACQLAELVNQPTCNVELKPRELRQLLTERAETLEALKNAHDAIKSLPIDAFGNGSYTEANGEEEFYPIRDELCNNIARVITHLEAR